MLFGNDRDSLRQMYRNALKKSDEGLPMTPLESQIAGVIADHPEYRRAINPTAGHTDDPLSKDYRPEAGETNPFMHMSLHLAVRDQIATNRPTGIRDAFNRLSRLTQDAHGAEHVLCEHMAEELWQAQRHRRPPDEQRYLRQVLSTLQRK